MEEIVAIGMSRVSNNCGIGNTDLKMNRVGSFLPAHAPRMGRPA